MPSFIDLYRAARTREAPRFMLASSELPAGFERECVVCGREGQATAVYGRVPVVIIAGSATPPPPTIGFCEQCAQDHQLGPGVSVAEDLINAWRSARGLPERRFG